jgi:hypothetical protein
MSRKARDVHYGRRGGHWIDGDPPAAPSPCTECGSPVHSGGTIHETCRPEEVADVQPEALF